jgi:acyl carrier protein
MYDINTISEEQVQMLLETITRNVLNIDSSVTLAPETNLYDVGLDSMTVVALLVAIEEETGIVFDEGDLTASLFERFENLLKLLLAQRVTN